MKFRSCDCVWFRDLLDVGLFDDATPDGAFCYQQEIRGDRRMWVLWIKMPYEHPMGAGSIHALHVFRPGQPRLVQPSWQLTGTAERPTLKPSIACGPKGEEWYWHGWLTDGRLTACE